VTDQIELALTLNGKSVRHRTGCDKRLLDFLREDLRLTGVKEGCGKGECGACSVIMDGQVVDSCLMMAYQADGSVLETIEGLADGGKLHPLQDAFIETGGVQCGICIPGMIMAGKRFLDGGGPADETSIRQALAGNLCRCTGYTKIFAAVASAAGESLPAETAPPRTAPVAPAFYRPRQLEEAVEILALRGSEVRPLAGGTDILVAAKDARQDRAALFDVSAVPELRGIKDRDDHVWIGAAVTHTEIVESALLARWVPALPPACAVIGGPQIRNRGTVGGNLANASPAADTVPPLLAAEAVVELVSVGGRRELPLPDFIKGYRETALAHDELIVGLRVPKRTGVRGTFLRLGQRQAQAISKVSVAVAMTFRDGQPDWVRVTLGSVAPTVVRAPEAEKALLAGGYEGLQRAKEAVRNEVAPIDDLRSNRDYRREMTAVLLERAVRKVAEA
jgi:carbon-monoxide dehydrogenase small subunit/xanthine dehydrogenase small subunit